MITQTTTTTTETKSAITIKIDSESLWFRRVVLGTVPRYMSHFPHPSVPAEKTRHTTSSTRLLTIALAVGPHRWPSALHALGVTNLALKLISDSGSSLGKPPVLPVSLPVRKALPSNDGMRDSLPRPGGRCAVFGAPGATVSGTASGDQSHGLSTRHAALFFLPSGSTDRASCWSTRLDSAAGNLPCAGERKGDPVTPTAVRCRGGLAVDTCQPTAYAVL